MDTTYAARLIRAWVKRREDKGTVVTADAIDQRIKHNWPKASDDDVERVFQACA